MINIVEAKKGIPIRDVDMPSAGGLTPLHVAALSGSNLCIAYLLGMGADTTKLDALGRLAIHWAGDGGHAGSIMHLAAAGQDLSAKDNDGNTPLHLAARKGKIHACDYLVEIGADLSVKNNRGWTPVQTATVPTYRVVLEALEQFMTPTNQIRRNHDQEMVAYFLQDCGLERFEHMFRKAGYTGHDLFVSARPVSFVKLNAAVEEAHEKMDLREYILFLECLQRFNGVKKSNPYALAAKKQKHWDLHPEEFEKFLSENPDYDATLQDDSEYARAILPKEEEFMKFMHDVVEEIRRGDKNNFFGDILQTKLVLSVGRDGIANFHETKLEFEGIENITDCGWNHLKVLDFNQLHRNIDEGMYACWEQFQLDYMIMICNIFIYCREAKSDMQDTYKVAQYLAGRGLRIFRKHRTSLTKLQAASDEEKRELAESVRPSWSRWGQDKRLRGLLPDKFREVLEEAEDIGDKTWKRRYTRRFKSLEDAKNHWGFQIKNMVEIGRTAWEQDNRQALSHKSLRWCLDFTASRDQERHFQHPPEDIRSDAHLPGSDHEGPFDVETYLREIVWPMDFDTMREKLAESWEPDYYFKRPEDYRWTAQVQLDWLIIQTNALLYHQKYHEDMKVRLTVQQQPRYMVPKAPAGVSVAPDHPLQHECKVLWNQPPPKPGELAIAYRLNVKCCTEQEVDIERTGATPGQERIVDVEIEAKYTKYKLAKIQESPVTAASWRGGICILDKLSAATMYEVLIQTISQGDIVGPISGPVLRFQTKPGVPDPPPGLAVLHVSNTQITFKWDTSRDNGSDIIDYEVEYIDHKFHRTFCDRVGWKVTNFSTVAIMNSACSEDPLSKGLEIPPLVGMILPATRLEARSRARNRAGWSRWNDVVGVQTKCTPALQPMYPALFGTGHDYLEIAWMPPISSCSPWGVRAYKLEITIEQGNEKTTRFEEFSTDELLSEIQQRNYATRPPTSSRRSTPSGRRSRPGSRPGTRGGSRPGSKGGASVSGSSPTHTRPSTSQTGGRPGTADRPESEANSEGLGYSQLLEIGDPEETEDAPVELPEIDFGLPSRPPEEEWWSLTPFYGKLWFYDKVPDVVTQRASLDFPVIGMDNNLIVLQIMGQNGWEPELYALLPPMSCSPAQLAIRTESALQGQIPIEVPMRFQILCDTKDVLTFVLNRQFRLKMSASLTYIFGFVMASDGWVTSPPIKNIGLTDDRSMLDAPYPCKVNTLVCDLIPKRIPFMHRLVDLPPSSKVSVRIRGKNGGGDEYGDKEGLGFASESIHGITEAIIPKPPTNVRAEGVLTRSITVSWTLPEDQTIRPLLCLLVSFILPDGSRAQRKCSARSEGYQISNLMPGQWVKDIQVRSVNANGTSLPSDGDISAVTLAAVPSRPQNFRQSDSTPTSIMFEWDPPGEDGGSTIIEYDVTGFAPDGKLISLRTFGERVCTYTWEPDSNNEDVLNIYLLNAGVRCRNKVGWSQKSTEMNARSRDADPPPPDRMNKRIREQNLKQQRALERLRAAIQGAEIAEADAERAARQPARLKKLMMEEAENSVMLAEHELEAAIAESEETGIKEMGVAQPREDIQARMTKERLRQKRGRRWGASKRGLQV